MKFLIVLSAILLIPIVMKFQTRTLLGQRHSEISRKVIAILEKHQVTDPEVKLEYLDVSIGGFVGSEETVRLVAQEVDAIRGVRLVDTGLSVEGWLEISRKRGELSSSGLAPLSWRDEAFKGLPGTNFDGLRTKERVAMAGKSAASWGIFFDAFFKMPGQRTLTLKNGILALEGETTPSGFAMLKDLAKSQGEAIHLKSSLQLRPSRFHFAARNLESPVEGEPLRSLSQKLADSLLKFEGSSEVLTTNAKIHLNELAALLVQSDPAIRFVAGAHPDSGGVSLAARRAQKVRQQLLDMGVGEKRLQVESFEMTEDESGLQGQVELLIR